MAELHVQVDPEALLRNEIAEQRLDLPVLPSVAAEVLASSQASDTSAARLAALIQQDQALTSNVLRVVNSATYRGAIEIVALQQAIARLGMSLIREIALSVCLKAAINKPGPYDQQVQSVWQQALAAALWSRELARRCRKNVENAYLCGLLHNIGVPVVLHRLAALAAAPAGGTHLPVEAALALAREFAVPAGSMLVANWQLPALIATCMQYHDDFRNAAEAIDMVAIVVSGVELAAQLDAGELSADSVQQWPTINHLNLYPDEIAELVAVAPSIEAQLSSLNS